MPPPRPSGVLHRRRNGPMGGPGGDRQERVGAPGAAGRDERGERSELSRDGGTKGRKTDMDRRHHLRRSRTRIQRCADNGTVRNTARYPCSAPIHRPLRSDDARPLLRMGYPTPDERTKE